MSKTRSSSGHQLSPVTSTTAVVDSSIQTDRASDRKSPVPTGLALKQRAGLAADPTHVGAALSAQEPKPRRPARPLQRCCGLRFGTEALEKFGRRQSRLKLTPVHGHSDIPRRNALHLYSIAPRWPSVSLWEHRCCSGRTLVNARSKACAAGNEIDVERIRAND